MLRKKWRNFLLKLKYFPLVLKYKISFKYLYNHPVILTVMLKDQAGNENWYMLGDGLDIISKDCYRTKTGVVLPRAMHMDVYDLLPIEKFPGKDSIFPNGEAVYLYNQND